MSEPAGVTPAMRNCFRMIESYISTHGCSPSYEDLRASLGLNSKAGVKRLVASLQARGWITYQSYIPRSIAIVPGVDSVVPKYVLPQKVEHELRMYCTLKGEDPSNVVADAVALFLDSFTAQAAA